MKTGLVAEHSTTKQVVLGYMVTSTLFEAVLLLDDNTIHLSLFRP